MRLGEQNFRAKPPFPQLVRKENVRGVSTAGESIKSVEDLYSDETGHQFEDDVLGPSQFRFSKTLEKYDDFLHALRFVHARGPIVPPVHSVMGRILHLLQEKGLDHLTLFDSRGSLLDTKHGVDCFIEDERGARILFDITKNPLKDERGDRLLITPDDASSPVFLVERIIHTLRPDTPDKMRMAS